MTGDDRAARRTDHHEADVVVVGAGVFGCAAAHALASQDRSVLLLERWMHEPDRIVGELLQPGGVRALRKLGLEGCVEDIDAIPCYGYHVLYHGEDVVIPYPVVDEEGDVVFPQTATTNGTTDVKTISAAVGPRPEGRSFHHGRFIMQLRRACQRHPNISIVETEVTGTIKGEASREILGVQALTKDKDTGKKRDDYFFGTLTVIADGYASKFREEFLGSVPVVRSKFFALELIDCHFPPYGFGHVVIGQSSLVLLYQIGTHETRALINIPVAELEKGGAAHVDAGGVRAYIRSVVVPALPEHVRQPVLAALADGKAPKSMPNSWLPPTRQAPRLPPGVLLAGDAANMRHPLTGGGMTVALQDALLLRDLLPADLADRAALRAAVATYDLRRRRHAMVVNVLAQALYSLFSATDPQLAALRAGCFAYFRRGVTDEPVAMLGGLLRRPGVLASHFFTVAFLAVWLHGRALVEEGFGGLWLGVLRLPLALLDAVLILWKACVVFLPVLWLEVFGVNARIKSAAKRE
jgi:squalene monooxygenase